MKEPKLTSKQVELLFDFCKEHYVPYYDLQVELVDHLASSIEDIWEQKPKHSFEEALHQTYHKFGIFGFSKIKANREKALLKKYKGLLWQYVRQYFRLPRIFVTFVLTILLFVVFNNTEKDSIIAIGYIFAVLLFEILYFTYIFPKYYKIKTIPGKKFLINNTMKNIQGSLAVMPMILIQLVDFLRKGDYPTFNAWLEFFASLSMVVFTLFIIALSFYVPDKIRNHFEEQFPQFVKS